MSHHFPVPKAERFDPKKAAPVASLFKGAAGVGLAGSALAFIFTPTTAASAWLFGFMYFFTVLMGCFFWNCLHHATDSEWSVVVRRQIENLASLLRYIGVFFIPLALVLLISPGILYDWYAELSADHLKDLVLADFGTKHEYLNKPFFWCRAVAFFGLVYFISSGLRKRSMLQDKDGAAKHTIVMRKLGVAGIPTLAIVITFAGIDWLQTLNHHWYSTMWGVYLFAGAVGSSMALIVLVCKWLQSLGYLKPVNEEHYHLMGKFLLAFTIFWGYIGFAQYMLITYANIPEETIYFRLRNTGPWYYLSSFLMVGRFFLMFVPLLFQGIKKSKAIIFCSAWILFMQFLDIFVIVMPERSPGSFPFWGFIVGVFAWLGIAGSLGLLYLKHLRQGVTFPTKDPRLAESLKFSN